jgi:hypothetical protein
MAFSDYQEKIIEKVLKILREDKNAIKNEFSRFNTIYPSANINKDHLNIEIQIEDNVIAKVMKFDLDRFFSDRYYNFEKTFEYRLWHYENIPDDLPFNGVYEIDHGAYTMEYSQFGMETRWVKGEMPFLGGPIIKEEEDIENLEIPDYFTTGYMPKIIEEYYKIKDDLNERLLTGVRKPFQGFTLFSSDLRGIESFYIDLIANPEFVKKMFDFYVKFYKAQIKGWEKLHNRKYGLVHWAEDTIDTKQVISPRIYREIILPAQIEFARELEAIHFHTCGDVLNVTEDILKIPNITLFQIGPITDAYESAKLFKEAKNVKLYKLPNFVTEVLCPEPGAQEKMIESTIMASEIVPVKLVIFSTDLDAALKLLNKFRKIYSK